MRFLPTKVHGYLDYIVGALLIAAPWLLNFDRGGAETWVPVILGVGAVVYSLFTDYELGVTARFGMRTHLSIDFMSGVILAASPWVLGFADFVFLPHLILGILEIGVSLITKLQPQSGPGHRTTNSRTLSTQ